MTTSLAALNHNEIHTKVCSTRRVSGSGDGPKHNCACVLSSTCIRCNISLPKGYDAAPRFKRRIESTSLISDEGQIYTETVTCTCRGDIAGQYLSYFWFRHMQPDESHCTLMGECDNTLRSRRTT